ncbi:F-BAR and double SH3 domains protein 2 [Nematostella vectensis]|uniref:F-BAR and double SH3 domains protein 2 n=1 Tax=Nematostella vectensis TaxID=45351 RepID=UPI00207781D8|nr:F-BAR and double SH3 domains protein 2 [Nematostella vectensis]
MAAQPPVQRKPAKQAKILQSLRNIQTEQTLKLQQKFQFEQDLLEDIRVYAKQRSAIEKEYSQALQKLDSQFIQKREFSADEITGNERYRTPLSVWKTVLDESASVGKHRLEMAEALLTQVADSIKAFKTNKAQIFKKNQELLQKIHEEIFTTVREMSKSKKGYMEMEKLAHVAREQAAEAEDKYKKKNVKFFQSKSTLEKNVSKSSNRKETSERRSTMARNEYLLCLAASNAHAMRYYCTDLQEIMNSVYGDFYDKVREYFSIISNLGVEASTSEHKGYAHVGSEASMIDKNFCVETFLSHNKVLTEVLHYEYDPYRGDKINTILTIDKSSGLALNKEARKLALRLAREQKNIRDKQKALSSMNSSQGDLTDGPTDTDQPSADALREEIRHSEVIKLKAEACLELLKQAGVNVDEWIKSANSLSPNDASDKALSGSSSSLTADLTPDDHGGWDDEWDVDDTFTGDYESDEDVRSLTSASSQLGLCVVLYSFEATTEDELSITEHEELELLEIDGEGWCKGRNKAGKVGFFPEAYVEKRTKEREGSIHSSSGHSVSGSVTGSIGERSPVGTPVASPVVAPVISPLAAAHRASSASLPVTTAVSPVPEPTYLCMVRALYDYEAMSDEELSFNEGDTIYVTKQDDHGVDDGFWEGYIDGHKGVFPSLVVEEIEGSASPPPVTIPVVSPPSTGQEAQPPATNAGWQGRGDYVDLADSYSTIGKAPSLLQPARKAPPPPRDSPLSTRRSISSTGRESTNMGNMDRQRAQTENLATMSKPEGQRKKRSSLFSSDESFGCVADPRTADYVNTRNLPHQNGPPRDKPNKPSLPPPPTTTSRKNFQSHSQV